MTHDFPTSMPHASRRPSPRIAAAVATIATIALLALCLCGSALAGTDNSSKRYPGLEATFTTQDHREVRFSELVEGRRIALQFIFTSCGMICPPMGAQFAALGKLLDEEGIEDVHLISVSIDPARDTPDKLAAWANRFGHDADRLTLITAPQPSTDALLRALGIATGDKTDHPAIVLLNNGRDHQWRPVNALGRPAEIVDALDRLESPALALEDNQ